MPFDAGRAYLEFYRPAVHIMRSLHQQGKLDSLQASFFTGAKLTEELYDLENDPRETNNLINDHGYRDQLIRLRNMLDEWEYTFPESIIPSDHDLGIPRYP